MLKKRISMLLVAVMIITGIPCMPKAEVSAASKDTYTIDVNDSSYDPRGTGRVTMAKDQGSYGICYAYALASAVETSLIKTGQADSSVDISDMQIAYTCSCTNLQCSPYKNSNRHTYYQILSDMNGGMEETSYYRAHRLGFVNETDMPIALLADNSTFDTWYNLANNYKYKIKRAYEVPAGDIQGVKEIISKCGSVVTSYLTSDYLYNTTLPVYSYNNVSDTLKDSHAIQIVGWDDNYSKDNFKDNNKPKNNGAWLIKNSWGNYNDEGVYFWISDEDKTLLQAEDNFYISGVCDINDGKRIYQHDEFGPTAYIYSIDNETKEEKQIIECTNVYDFEDGYDVLEGITFMTSSIGAKYKISYAQVEDTNIIDENKTIVLAEGTVPHAGFITASVDGVKVPEGKGYIIVSIDNSGNNKEALIGAETLSDNCVRKINKGESYMIVQNYAIDSFEYSDEENAENYTIKVIARNTEGKIVAQDIIDKQKEALNESETNNNSSANRSSEAISEKGDFILIIELVSILLVIIFFINKSRRK